MRNEVPPSRWKDPWTYAQIAGYIALAAALLRAHGPSTWKALWEAMSGQTAAAWVQAVGSVATIAIALWIARKQIDAQHKSALSAILHQHQLERSAAAEVAIREEIRQLEAFCDVARHGASCIATAIAAYSDDAAAVQFVKVQVGAMNYFVIRDAMNATDVRQMSSANLALALLAAKQSYVACVTLVHDLSQTVHTNTQRPSTHSVDRLRAELSVLGTHVAVLDQRTAELCAALLPTRH